MCQAYYFEHRLLHSLVRLERCLRHYQIKRVQLLQARAVNGDREGRFNLRLVQVYGLGLLFAVS